jgi:hypothetical protein
LAKGGILVAATGAWVTLKVHRVDRVVNIFSLRQKHDFTNDSRRWPDGPFGAIAYESGDQPKGETRHD